MKTIFSAVLVLLLLAYLSFAQEPSYPKAKVSFDDFKRLMGEAEAHRARRLIDLETFNKYSKEPGVVVLDARSNFRFENIHVKGAKNLAFTDFTEENLRKVIPSLDTPILIYCNNNFDGERENFEAKQPGRSLEAPSSKVARNLNAEAKPTTLALNIPTYVTLYGYGYRNIFELDELVSVKDRRVALEGTTVQQKPLPVAQMNAPPKQKSKFQPRMTQTQAQQAD